MSGKSVTFLAVCCLAAFLSIIVYFLSDSKSEKAIPVLNTLSSDQLLGLGYTDPSSANTDDIWDDPDFSYSNEEKGTSSVNPAAFPIDINAATADELVQIKGIGSATAEKIISYRTSHGSFHSADELLNVDGIGSKKLSEIRNYIYVDPEITSEISETTASMEDPVIVPAESETVTIPTSSDTSGKSFPIELNTASAEELMTINGVGEVIAEAIVEYAQSVGFSETSDLMNVPGIGEKRFENIAPYVYVEDFSYTSPNY